MLNEWWLCSAHGGVHVYVYLWRAVALLCIYVCKLWAMITLAHITSHYQRA